MKTTFYIGLFLLFSTIAMIIVGIIKGYIGFGFFIFPIIYGSGLYAGLAILALILSFFIIILSLFDFKDLKKIDIGGVVLIGPVPIVFGNSKIMVLMSIIVALIIIFLILFL